MSFFYNLKYRFGTFSIAEKIILINVVLFLFPMLLNVLFFLFNIPTSSYLNWLQLSPNLLTFIKRPWSLITYSFVHSGFFHLLWNMVLLYYAGRLLLNLFPDRIFINNYFLGVISGGLIFISSYSIFPVFEGNYPPLIGASAGVMAVFIFICTYTPNQEIRFFLVSLLRGLVWLSVSSYTYFINCFQTFEPPSKLEMSTPESSGATPSSADEGAPAGLRSPPFEIGVVPSKISTPP